MRLNGWQRLWIVFTVLWMFAVGVMSYVLWPMPMPVAEVRSWASFAANAPAVGASTELLKVFQVEPASIPVGSKPEGSQTYRVTLSDGRKFNVTTDGGPPTEQDLLSNVEKVDAGREQIVEIPGVGRVSFPTDMSVADMSTASARIDREARRALGVSRSTFAAMAFAAWILPTIAFYALGWSIGWVRRGFKQLPPPIGN